MHADAAAEAAKFAAYGSATRGTQAAWHTKDAFDKYGQIDPSTKMAMAPPKVVELEVEDDFRDSKPDWTQGVIDDMYRWGCPGEALDLYRKTVTDSAKAAFEADGIMLSMARQIVEIINRSALKVEMKEEVGIKQAA
ncbi:hypothetical protein FOA52_015313 [Chlamydomonas sp. UWO 241]|nr:hypothetical protein FOA52_015313 [Chlamydomonas sp. UWO 241]